MALANAPLFIEDGYLEMARVWASELADALFNGYPVREKTMLHLISILKAIGDGTPADVAFGLKRVGGGRPRKMDEIQKNNRLATRVLELKTEGLPLNDGKKGLGAYSLTAKEFYVQPKRVKEAWKLCGERLETEHLRLLSRPENSG